MATKSGAYQDVYIKRNGTLISLKLPLITALQARNTYQYFGKHKKTNNTFSNIIGFTILKKGASAPTIFQSVKGYKSQRVLIPEATDRETVTLNVAVPAWIAEIVIQDAAEGGCCSGL
jgi:hypothetical protein